MDMAKNTASAKGELKLVSFKVSPELYKALEELAEKQSDDGTGIIPSPSIVARKLLVESLKSKRLLK